MSSPDDYFLSIAQAILQNKNTLFDSLSTASKFATWQGSAFDQHDTFGLNQNQGLMIKNWNDDVRGPNIIFSLSLQLLDGNKTDQKGVLVEMIIDKLYSTINVNRSNATVIVPNHTITFQEQKSEATQNYRADIYVYFVDKITKKPPEEFNTTNLKAYTAQFRVKVLDSSVEFSTTFLDDTFPISLRDKLVLWIGCLVYLGINIATKYRPARYDSPIKTISHLTFFLLLMYPIYTICYISVWFSKMAFMISILPLALVMFFNFIKIFVEMCYNGSAGCLCVCIYPLPMLLIAFHPHTGLYIGDLLCCIYFVPQVFWKYMHNDRRERWLTRYEIGTWLYMSLWIYYMNIYPHNVFLTSPKPVVAIIYFIATLIQLGVLIYLEVQYPGHLPDNYPEEQPDSQPRKISHIFRKFTVSMNDPKFRSKLLSNQCAICIEDFEANSKDKLYKTPCGHFFHAECLKSWAQNKLDCPVCRARLVGIRVL